MDIDSNPIENRSEPMESNETITENGCDDDSDTALKVSEAVTHQLDDKDISEPIASENEQKDGDDNDSSPVKSPHADEPIILSASETEPCELIDSDNPSENNSPEKNSSAPTITDKETEVAAVGPAPTMPETEAETATPVDATADTSIEMVPCNDEMSPVETIDETANDASQRDDDKNDLDMGACLIPSPSDPMAELIVPIKKGWNQIDIPSFDESIEDVNGEDDGDGDGSDDDFDEDGETKRPKAAVEQKSNDCEILELTDDNSSCADDARESDDEIDDEEDEEEEEEDDDDESGNNLIEIKQDALARTNNYTNQSMCVFFVYFITQFQTIAKTTNTSYTVSTTATMKLKQFHQRNNIRSSPNSSHSIVHRS